MTSVSMSGLGIDGLVWNHKISTAPVSTERRLSSGKPVSDEMPMAVQSMADGRMYTSRAMLRRSYRASGNPQGVEYTEVGNDPARFRQPEPYRGDERAVADAIEKARARYARGERV